MYGKVKNIWDIKTNGGGSSTPIDTSNFAKKNEANTFTQKNTFENTGNVISIKTTDNQAFGIEFKDNNDQHVGFVGTKLDGSEQKAHMHGYLGLGLSTQNKDVNINPGSAQLLYHTTSTSKNRREVLVRNDLWYVQKATHASFNVAGNSAQTAQYTYSGLVQGLHELYVVLTTSGVNIGFDMKIYVNSTNYPNQSEVKIISLTNWTNNEINKNALLQFGIVLYDNDKIRWRINNLGSSQVSFSSLKIYQRIPGGIVG